MIDEQIDAVHLGRLLSAGQLHPMELLDATIRRIEAVNPKINAVVQLLESEALHQIRAGLPDSPLAGVPILLKDLRAHYAGVPTTAGSRFFRTDIKRRDSRTVLTYRQAGLVMVGKTNTPELGGNLSTEPAFYGPTRNPWGLDRIAGGSSGGSAAAVAAGIVTVAHATDGGGSIRVPASCCGLFGLKPSSRRFAQSADFDVWAGMSAEHVLTRTVQDSAVFLDLMRRGSVSKAALEPLRRPKRKMVVAVGLPDNPPLDEDATAALSSAITIVESLAHRTVVAHPNIDMSELGPAYRTIVDSNLATSILLRASQIGREPTEDELEPITLERLESGRRITAVSYLRAIDTLNAAARALDDFFLKHDVYMTPTVTSVAPPLGIFPMSAPGVDAFRRALHSFSPFCYVANATGHPAMSVPLYWTSSDMPVGIHFVGSAGKDLALLELAAQLEYAHPWAHRKPRIWAN